MIAGILMAAWYWYMARKAGEGWFMCLMWALRGAIIFAVLQAVLLFVVAPLVGDAYSISAVLLTTVPAIAAAVWIGRKFIRPVETLRSASDPSPQPPTSTAPLPEDTRPGTCPSCEKTVKMSARICPNCRADFGPGSAYKVRLARDDA